MKIKKYLTEPDNLDLGGRFAFSIIQISPVIKKLNSVLEKCVSSIQ
jgi:hypothetical protein